MLRDILFWFHDGRSVVDRLRLLAYWQSPHILGYRNRAPRRVRTRYRDGRPLYIRPCSPDARLFRNIFSRADYSLPAEGMGRVNGIIDLGAYSGLSTVYLAERFPDARIVAVEPDAENYSCLKLNSATIPRSGRVGTIQAAVSDRSGLARFFDRGPQWARHVDSGGGAAVRTITMPELLDEAGFDVVDLVKVDIEGAERLLLEGLSEWESRCRWILMEVHFPALPLRTALEHLDRCGRNRVLVREEGHWSDLDRSRVAQLQGAKPYIEILVPPSAVLPGRAPPG